MPRAIFNVTVGPICHVYDPVGEYAYLSNYAHTPISLDGKSWPTVEHAFQGYKFDDPEIKEMIRGAHSGAEAKAIAWDEANASSLIPGWDARREGIMARLLVEKFGQHQIAAAVLRDSWPLPIVESSPDDSFWGLGADGHGNNMLGKLLGRVRGDLTGLPEIFQTVGTILGRGGRSESVSGPIETVGHSGPTIDRFELAYPAFARVDIEKALQDRPNSSDINLIHADLLDLKYGSYEWTEDARSAVHNWAWSFRGLLSAHVPNLETAKILAVGAGSASEPIALWREFGHRATLVDWGHRLARICAEGAPASTTLRARAELLTGVPDHSQDVYVSLRTYDSAHLNVAEALSEARRTLRPGGTIIISISDGYLTSDGTIVRGQIGPNGEIDRSLPWTKLHRLAGEMQAAGCHIVRFFNLNSEIGIVGLSERH